MKADEIRQECSKNIGAMDGKKIHMETAGVLQYGALMEIAAQLAELNARLANKF